MVQYDRIDPAEVQTLKDEISQSKKEAAEAQERLRDCFGWFHKEGESIFCMH